MFAKTEREYLISSLKGKSCLESKDILCHFKFQSTHEIFATKSSIFQRGGEGRGITGASRWLLTPTGTLRTSSGYKGLDQISDGGGNILTK